MVAPTRLPVEASPIKAIRLAMEAVIEASTAGTETMAIISAWATPADPNNVMPSFAWPDADEPFTLADACEYIVTVTNLDGEELDLEVMRRASTSVDMVDVVEDLDGTALADLLRILPLSPVRSVTIELNVDPATAQLLPQLGPWEVHPNDPDARVALISICET